MTDDYELSKKLSDAAWALARAMNEAAETGLLIEVKMTPHESLADNKRVYELKGFRPEIEVKRIIYPLTSKALA